MRILLAPHDFDQHLPIPRLGGQVGDLEPAGVAVKFEVELEDDVIALEAPEHHGADEGVGCLRKPVDQPDGAPSDECTACQLGEFPLCRDHE